MKVNIGGSWKPVTSAKINVGGALKTLTRMKHYVSGAFKDGANFYVALTASASIGTPLGNRFDAGNVTTNSVTITPAGGYAPYTYAWTRLSGTGSANSATSATTTFTAYTDLYEVLSGTFRCTVTDSHGATVTVDVNATFNNNGPSGA